MAIYVNTIPQNISPIKTLTIKELVNILPEIIDYELNVWIGGKLAKYGKTTENLIFLIQSKDFPSSEIMMYFNSFVKPLNFQATVSNAWKNINTITAVKLYNKGRLIIDKETMTYKELPSIIEEDTFITFEDVLSKLPSEIEWKFNIYLTGGIVKNGFSNNDVDFIVFDIDKITLNDIRRYISSKISYKTHVGSDVMSEREPVYLYKIYENGLLCLPK